MVFRQILLKTICYTINEAHKQYSLLDAIFNYIFYFGPPGNHLYLSLQNPLHVGRLHVVGFRTVLLLFSWRSKTKDVAKYCIY